MKQHPRQNLYYFSFIMLVRNRAKLFVMILSIVFSTFIIIQQPAIFNGISARMVGLINDNSNVDIWIMDKGTASIEHYRPFSIQHLYQIRNLPGILWAEPLLKFTALGTHIATGEKAVWSLVGIGKTQLIGAPPQLVSGNINDLKMGDKLIINESDQDYFSSLGKQVKIQEGDTIDFRNVSTTVIGVGKSTPRFLMNPMVHTDYDTAATILGDDSPSFILVKAKPHADVLSLIQQINKIDDLRAYTPQQFKKRTLHYFLYNTAFVFNFALVVLLGYIIGFAIVAITFYNFVSDHLYQYGTLKALGARNKTIMSMVFAQTLVLGIVGYFLGLLFVWLFGLILSYTRLAYELSFTLLAISYLAIIFICIAAALLAIRQILSFNVARVFEA